MKYSLLFVTSLFNITFLSETAHLEFSPVYKNIRDKKEAYKQIAIQKNLKTEYQKKEYLYQEDYSWDYTFEELGKLYQEIYESGKQLPNPVYYNSFTSSFMMPIDESCELPVSWDFIFAVICHVEQALENKMADYIFLPDMGHGHFFLPGNHNLFLENNVSDKRVFLAILTSKDVKILYHTAEMFLFFGTENDFLTLSPHEQFRNKTRNLLGSFHVCDTMISYIPYQFGSPVVNSIDSDYRRVSQDIDISANKNGTFPFAFKGKFYYFDISRYSPRCKQIN